VVRSEVWCGAVLIVDVSVVRYEDLARPVAVCKRLMQFVFEGDASSMNTGVQTVCVQQLGLMQDAAQKKASAAIQLANNRAMGGIGVRSGDRALGQQRRQLGEAEWDGFSKGESRMLRLLNYNTNSSTVAIDSKRLQASSTERLHSFQTLVDDVATPSHLQALATVNMRLQSFGYNLLLSSYWAGKQKRLSGVPPTVRQYLQGTASAMGREPTSILDPWDLMK
jgi:hypothetical protein